MGTWAHAAEQQAPEPPLPVVEVAPGVYVHQAPYALALPRNLGFVGNAGFIIGRDAVAVVDTGGSLKAGEALKAAVQARTDRPVRYVINTHMHPDHVLGDAAFAGPGVTFIGHHNLPEALAARSQSYLEATRRLVGDAGAAGTRVVLPDVTVADRLTIDLGARPLLLEAWPTAHTATDLTVLDETSGTWFLGDLLFLGHVPALDGKALGWIGLLDELKRRPVARVVPGHGPASQPWPQAAEPTERYLKRLVADVRRLVRDGGTMSDAAREAGRAEAPDWALFNDFNARNATSAYHELEWE
ncbi:quinoprotein relay system zinc metallohydrolase 2 [Xanthobacter agilis]|uniref:quinoprotein relay system zinc metallohydrolase 2 n=1 Tax=Xanthobacter agilis TaxID=47492 RepID=UPI0037271FA4